MSDYDFSQMSGVTSGKKKMEVTPNPDGGATVKIDPDYLGTCSLFCGKDATHAEYVEFEEPLKFDNVESGLKNRFDGIWKQVCDECCDPNKKHKENNPMNMDEVIDAIFEMDKKELKQVQGAIKEQWNILARRQKARMAVGTRVKFTGKNGRVITGTIIKKMQKNIKVDGDDNKIWHVHPTLLEEIDE